MIKNCDQKVIERRKSLRPNAFNAARISGFAMDGFGPSSRRCEKSVLRIDSSDFFDGGV